MLVHIVTRRNRSAYSQYLDEMFEMRRRVFIEELRWERLSAPDGRERDFIDEHEDVEYLLTIDDFGQLVGSGRFSPTTRPHLLDGPLKDYSERDYEPGPDCWEFTRYIPTETNDSPVKLQARAYILTAMVEWSVRRNVRRLLGISPLETLAFTSRMGWRNGLLGMPVEYQPGQSAVAMHFDLDRASLASTRRYWDLEGPVTFEARGAKSPFTAQSAAVLDQLAHHSGDRIPHDIAAALDLDGASEDETRFAPLRSAG